MMRRRSAKLVVDALFASTLLVGPAAHAYVQTATTVDANHPVSYLMQWPSACIWVTAYVADPPPNLAAGQFLAAARAAANAWNTAIVPSRGMATCSGLSLNIASTDQAEGPASQDDRNRLTFRRRQWRREPFNPAMDAPYDPAALAITTVLARRGAIFDTDVEVNAVNFKWADVAAGGTAAFDAQDVQNTLTHEFGHLIGLDHNCLVEGGPSGKDNAGNPIPNCKMASPAVKAATMYASVVRGDTTRRTLEEDDSTAVCDLYPIKSAVLTCPQSVDDTGGCAVSGRSRSGGPGLFGLLLAIGLAARRRVRR